MTIVRRVLDVKVKVVDQANAVGPTSIEGSFFLVIQMLICYVRPNRLGRFGLMAWRVRPSGRPSE